MIAPTTTLNPKISPSRVLAIVLAAAHLAAVTLLALTTLPAWAKLLLATIVATSGVQSILSTALLRMPEAIVELQVGKGRFVACLNRGGVWYEAQLLDSTFVTPWLTVLNLRVTENGITRHVIIVPDNVDADAFRRLRVWLRWGLRDSEAPSAANPSSQG